MIVYMNGAFIEESTARIAPSDRGFTLGDGVFDTLRAEDGVPQHAEQHFRRLLGHAAQLHIPVKQTAADLTAMAQELLLQNKLAAGSASVRTTLTRGPAARGLLPPAAPVPTLLMQAAALPSVAQPEQSLTAVIARHVRRNEHSLLSRIKSLNYGDNLAALMEAQERGCSDAILLNTAGHAACATIGNLFILENGTLVTPPLSDGVLNGVVRDIVIEKTDAREETIAPERLLRAQGIYLTNSIRGIRAVTWLDGQAIPSLNAFFDNLSHNISVKLAA